MRAGHADKYAMHAYTCIVSASACDEQQPHDAEECGGYLVSWSNCVFHFDTHSSSRLRPTKPPYEKLLNNFTYGRAVPGRRTRTRVHVRPTSWGEPGGIRPTSPVSPERPRPRSFELSPCLTSSNYTLRAPNNG